MGDSKKRIDKNVVLAWTDRVRDLRKAFKLALSILAESEELNYKKGIAGACKTLGYCYWRFSDYTMSLHYSLRAIEIYKEEGDKAGEADALNSLGAVYMFQEEHNKRLQCNLDCLKLREQIGDVKDIAGSQNNIGETYFEMGDIENALLWLNKALNNGSSDAVNIAWANFNIAKIHLHKKEQEKAIQFFNKALKTSLSVGYEVLIAESYIELSQVYIDINEINQALLFAQKAINLAKTIGSKEYLQNVYLLLAKIYEAKEDLTNALLFHKKYHATYVELFNEKKAEEIKDINYQYRLDRVMKESEIERIKAIELKSAYDKIETQNRLIEIKNKEFVDSVTYAKQIQEAFLADRKVLESNNLDSFYLFKPKDIVSGDFYWSAQFENYIYVVVGDCTGHGVPGAFLTMLGIAYLNESVTLSSLLSPNEILEILRKKIIKDISGKETYRDGMDVSIVRINSITNEIEWAGAKNPLWIIRKDQKNIDIISGDKQSVCYIENLIPFKNHTIQLQKGDRIYLFTDGYCDQFGGERGQKMGRKRFKEILIRNCDKPMIEQKKNLDYSYFDWREEQEQIDDVCIVGIKL